MLITFFILSANSNTFSPIPRSSLSFFFFHKYVFASYLSSDYLTDFIRSNLNPSQNFLLEKERFSTSSRDMPYFLLIVLFMFFADILIIWYGFLLFDFIRFNFDTPFFSSQFFYSATKAFPPLTLVENFLINSFISFF